MANGPFKMTGWSPFTKTEDKDDTYTKSDTSIVTSPRLNTIETRLNKLKNTDQAGMNRRSLIELNNQIKEGNKARKQELNRIQQVRGVS